MGKKVIKVVLNENIQKLGKSNDLVKVAAGYARNFLIPNKMAIVATNGILKKAKIIRSHKRRKI